MKEGAGTKNEPDGGVMMTKVASSSRELRIPAPLGCWLEHAVRCILASQAQA